MTEWEPATDAELAMRDALRTDDQETYFRILSDTELLLPVSAEGPAGPAPMGWGTWSSGGRTHVLAFTSSSALRACLSDYAGSARRIAYADLAETWPNLEWWLAVNPGLPIEGYLPAWFVAQLARGDLRLPVRSPRRDAATVRDTSPAAPPASGRSEAAVDAAAGNGVSGFSGPTDIPGVADSPDADSPDADSPDADSPDADSPGTASMTRAASTPGTASTTRTADATAPGAGADAKAGTGSGAGAGAPDAHGATGANGVAAAGHRAVVDTTVDRSTRDSTAVGIAVDDTRSRSTPEVRSGEDTVGHASDAGQNDRGRTDADRADRDRADADRADRDRADADRADVGGKQDGQGGPAAVPPGAEGDAGATAGGSATRTAGGGVPHGPSARVPTVAAVRAAEAAPAEPLGTERAVAVSAGPGAAEQATQDHKQAAQQQAAQQEAAQQQDAPIVPTPGGPLPRRPVTPQAERPTSMAAAAQALTQARPAAPVPATPGRRDPGRAEPGQVEPGRAEPGRAEPGRAEPGQVAPGSAEPGRVGEPAVPYRPNGMPVPAGPHAGPPHAGPPSDVDGDVRTPGDVDPHDEFVPANEVEQDLLNAADGGNTDIFLSTLLLATVLVPVAHDSRPGSAPGEPGFAYRTEEHDGDTFLVVFTSQERIIEHYAEPVRTHGIRFFELISGWPDNSWSFAVNPGSPVGAKLPGPQVVALASWAAEAGLGIDGSDGEGYGARVAEPVPAPVTQAAGAPAQPPTIMQKTVPPGQVSYFLERGYDRVSGFVHRANEVEHLRTPAELHAALGLGYDGSPHLADAAHVHVLRWPAYRPSLYRIPYGGQNEQALRAMDGWVIERPPFRGNGFAPGESRDVIAEFKVDSARLPHGAELWRIDTDGGQELIAVFDCDTPVWRRVGGTDA